MEYVKVVRSAQIGNLESSINLELSENASDKLVDIKYSSTYNDTSNSVIHTAIVIFEKK